MRRVVVKIGSALLTDPEGGLSSEKLEGHVAALSQLRNSVPEVVLVSSGAVAAGYERLNYTARPRTVVAKQACAAVGQGLLIQAYNGALSRHGLTAGQVLLTRGDFARRESYNNALNTLSLLLEKGIVPIINENDTVAVGELTFGENDLLAALVATLLQADYLIILSSTAGLYRSDPSGDSEAQALDRVDEITPEIRAMAEDSVSPNGTGGMKAKLAAVDLALSMGVPVFIGDGSGSDPDKIRMVLDGKGRGTYFGNPRVLPVGRKRQWIAYHANVAGRITIDDGASRALCEQGKSLLPVGLSALEGDFKAGDVVEVFCLQGSLIGKGIVNYSSSDLAKVRGMNTSQVKQQIAQERVEVIHRDDWVHCKCS
ncbi:MAG: glutamate 5-kinase [Deltaproteobacteria bacterium]|nr:glutamate 5-kinase [Deltaproteobacteria bacterium]